MSAVHIRLMIRRDMPEVLEIENDSFEFPWSEEDFIRCLQRRSCIGMVACDRDEHGELLGFMIYELHKGRLHLFNFAVAPPRHREGIGTAMVDLLKGKLSPGRRIRIALEVRESNLAAQLFFARQGFRATRVMHNLYEDTTEDAYAMEYRLPEKSNVPTNRIARLIR